MKTFYSSISTPVLKQNFRKMWMLVLLAFLAYFMTSCFFILANYSNLQNSEAATYLSDLISHHNLYIVVLDFFFPLLCAVFVFRYLHNSSAVTIIHELPLTRKGLFFTNALSGWIMAILPALLNGILLLCISKPLKVLSDEFNISAAYDSMPQVINIFSRSYLFGWLWQTLLLITLVYIIAVLAGMITGNSLMHFLIGGLLNVLPTGFLMCIELYMGTFLYGYQTDGQSDLLIAGMSPFGGIIFHHSNLPLWLAAVYLVLGILLLFLSCFLYEKRELEKTGQSLVFKWLDPVLCIAVTFLGMTGVGYLMNQLAVPSSSANATVYACFLLGSVLTFLITKLMVKKSLYIFNLSTLKHFAVYCIVAIVLVGSSIFDWTGFETKVPETADVKTASFGFGALHEDYGRFSSQYFQGDVYAEPAFSSEEAIRAVTDIHRDLITHRLRNDLDLATEFVEMYELSYGLKNGRELNRQYYVENVKDMKKRNSAALKQIYESEEFKSLFSWNKLKLDSTASITLTSPWFSSDLSRIRLTGSDLRELLSCVEKDFQSSTYEEFCSTRMPYAEFSLEFNTTKFDPHSVSETNMIRTDTADSPQILLDVIDANILHTDSRAVQWLRAHGYRDLFEPDLNKVKAMKISRYSKEALELGKTENEEDFPLLLDENQMYDSQITITDRKQMQRILDTCQKETDDDKVYVCTFLMETGVPESETLDDIHFTENSVPEFVKQKLNQKK